MTRPPPRGRECPTRMDSNGIISDERIHTSTFFIGPPSASWRSTSARPSKSCPPTECCSFIFRPTGASWTLSNPKTVCVVDRILWIGGVISIPFCSLVGYDFGGVVTDSRFRETLETHKRTASMSVKDVHCIYPGDLFLFLRKPLFLIVESDNSSAFQHIPRYFNQPLVVLMVRTSYCWPSYDC